MKKYMIVGILLFTLFFRLYQLEVIPPSPSLDEVSIGYNAYSILKTGKDEYGNAYPLLLRAYDDYRPALYVYLVVPFVGLFGLSALSVRLPSVILSLATVYLVFLIGRMIGKKYLLFGYLGEISSGILALSPWHIYLSRLGHEVNLGLTLVVLGIYFFLDAVIHNKKYSWIFSAVMFALSVHGYQSEKIVSPILVIVGVFLFRHDIWKAKKHVFVAVILGVLIVLPAFFATVSPEGMARFRGTSAIAGKRKLDAISIVVNNYASHFSPLWLFTGSDREAHKTPGMGLLYLWEAPLLVLGLFAFWRSKMPQKLKIFLAVWLFSSPFPASITTQAPHAMRSFTIVPALAIVEGMGMWFIIKHRFMVFFIGVIAMFGLFQFWKGYFVRFPKEQSDSFQFAIKPAIVYALEHENAYQRIEFSHQGALYQSYMFYLFYSRLDPGIYSDLDGTKSGGYEAAHYIGTYAFGYLPKTDEELKEHILYFYDINYAPNGARVVERFNNADGESAIVAITK